MTLDVDPRPLHRAALTWANGLVAAVPADLLAAPTPCPDFDVRAMLGHIVTTVDRARLIGEGGDPLTVPLVVTGVPDDDWATVHAAAVAKATGVWSDDALLDRTVTTPWATLPGRAAVWAYLNETLVHGWDLAVATGQDPEADPAVAEAALAAARHAIPEEPRGGHVPFGPVVTPRPGAGPTERLANWSGREKG